MTSALSSRFFEESDSPSRDYFNAVCCFSDKTDEDDSASAMYQAVSELPQANRDTLAYLVVHLQK